MEWLLWYLKHVTGSKEDKRANANNDFRKRDVGRGEIAGKVEGAAKGKGIFVCLFMCFSFVIEEDWTHLDFIKSFKTEEEIKKKKKERKDDK